MACRLQRPRRTGRSRLARRCRLSDIALVHIGASVAVDMFVSEELPSHWARLDEFEGPDYQHIVVPVLAGARVVAVANLYASR